MESAGPQRVEKAALAYGQGIAGMLDGDAIRAFRVLDNAISRRLAGDRQAQDILSSVRERPLDRRSCEALADELSYYSEVDSIFAKDLDSVLHRLDLVVR